MTVGLEDVVGQLRERLYLLVTWFRRDLNRLNQAQDERWKDPEWERRREDRAEVLRDGMAGALPTRAIDALLELEAVDLAAAMATPRSGPARRYVVPGAEESWVVPRSPRPLPYTSKQAGLLSTHLRYHAVIPTRVTAPGGATYDVKVDRMRNPARCELAVRRGHVVVGTTSFEDGARIAWCPDRGCAQSVATADARAAALAEALVEAASLNVDLLVAPELTIPPSQRAALHAGMAKGKRDRPRLAFAVLGSFHEGRAVDGKTQMFNIAVLVDGAGNRVFEHRKLRRFGDHPPDATDGAAVDTSPPEAIYVGNEIRVLSTPIGTVAVAICLDFCDLRLPIWQHIQPDWLLVPAYGPGGSAHSRAAWALSMSTGTVIVQAHEAKHSVRVEQPEDPTLPRQGGSFVQEDDRISTHSFAPAFGSYKSSLLLTILGLDRGPNGN